MLVPTSDTFLETYANEESVVRDSFTGMHRNDNLCRRVFLPTNYYDHVWELVRGAGSGPQAFGSTVKQTEEEGDLQLPPAIVFPGRMDTLLTESQFLNCSGEPVLTSAKQVPHSLVCLSLLMKSDSTEGHKV